MKFNGNKKGKIFDRTSFDPGNSGELSQKFICAKSNAEFLEVLEEEGVSIERRMERKGRKQILIEKLYEAPGQILLRETNGKWVNSIKKSLKQDPRTVTIISVVTDPTLKDSEDESQLERYNILGGNHFIKAAKQLLLEEPNNDYYHCLRMIQADVYEDLTVSESLRIAAKHNNMTNQRRLVFQDKVRLARKSYETGENDWKRNATSIIGCLDGKNYKMESMGTILSVAGYSNSNWLIAQEIFCQYEAGAKNERPFPQNLFRQLQGVMEENKTPYLSKAIGTNGLKVAQQIINDKRRETLKSLACQILNANNWLDVCDKYENADQFLSFTGNISTATGRENFATFITTSTKPNISIKIFKGTEDITGRLTEIAKKYSKIIEKELNECIEE